MYMNRIKYLDAIKFIAILSIICIHVAIIWPYSEIKGYNISGFSVTFISFSLKPNLSRSSKSLSPAFGFAG